MGGHAGELKTYLRVAAEWYWEGKRRQITNYIRECQICQKAKASHQSPAELLQNLPIPSQVWEHVTMDFIEDLPKSEGYATIFVVVDRLTKYVHFILLTHPFTTLKVANKFIREVVVKLHGFQSSIIFDRYKVFTSIF